MISPYLERRWEETLSSTEAHNDSHYNQTNTLPQGNPGAFGMPPGIYFQDQHITDTTYTIPTRSSTRRGKGKGKRTTHEDEQIDHSYTIFRQRYNHFAPSEEQFLDFFHWSDRLPLENTYDRLNNALVQIISDYLQALAMQRPYTDREIVHRFLDHRRQTP